MKIKFLIFLLLTSFTALFAEEVLICTPLRGGSVVLYNEEAIEKGKFDKKHISTDPSSPFNVPVVIGEVVPKGKDLIQVLYINGKKVAMFFPNKIKEKSIDWGAHIYAKYDREISFGGGYSDSRKRNGYPIFSWYPYKEFLKLESYKDSILYFVGNDDIRRMGYYYGHPYKIRHLGFDHSYKNQQDADRFNYLWLDFTPLFKDDSRRAHEMPLRPYGWAPHYGLKDHSKSIKDVLSSFVPQSEYMDSCRSKYNIDTLTSFSSKYLGQEVYLNGRYDQFESNSDFSQSGYWTLDSISFEQPSNFYPNSRFSYFAHFTSSSDPSKNYSLYIPYNGFKNIELAVDKRNRDESNRIAEEQRRNQERSDEEQEERKQEDMYAKKYGRANAKLIMNGEVKLGWTKEMCRESWGDPYDSTRVTTQYGSFEAWWYGSGYVLYFQGNKLVMIQD